MERAGVHGMNDDDTRRAAPRCALAEPHTRVLPWCVALSMLGLGCSGGDGDSAGDDSAGESATDGTGGDGDGDVEAAPVPSVRMMRLSHREWGNTVEDLLGIADTTELLAVLRPDPNQSGYIFDNNYESLSVDEALWNGYRIAAASAANMVVTDAALKEALFPASTDDLATRIETFVTSFGARAFRRPLSAEEVTLYSARFEAAPPLYPTLDAVDAGIALTIETML
ncbi:MAG: DUF1587 domain-containing protein, partial [Nannocystaceae bacterium]